MVNFFHTPIEVLDIAGSGLGSDGFQELQSLIKEEIKLVKINIRSIFVLNVLFCFNVMLQVTKKKNVVLHIQSHDMFSYLFSKNRGGTETAKFLSKLLSQAPQLVDVNAACNLMPIESLAIICCALKFAKGVLVFVLLVTSRLLHADRWL